MIRRYGMNEGKKKEIGAYDLQLEDGRLFLELVQESLHQGLECSKEESKIINDYLDDIAFGVEVVKSSK